MRKGIIIPDKQVRDIREYANYFGWSFSRTICYLAYAGQSNLSERGLGTLPKFHFNVDTPKKKIKSIEPEINPKEVQIFREKDITH